MAILPTQHHQPSPLQPRACKCVHANLAALGRLLYTGYDSSTLGPLLVPGPDLPWEGLPVCSMMPSMLPPTPP